MRFVLATIVFAVHLPEFTKVLPTALASLQPLGGKAAVLGFLLISGVSIGHSYNERPEGYFQRRFLRIYPLYFFAVGFALLLTYTIGSPYELPGRTMIAAGWKTNLANFFFLQDFASITITYNGPLWTISLEVFYYLLVPLLIRVRLPVLVAVIMASMLLFVFFPKKWLYGYEATRYAWPWLIGFLFAIKGPSKTVAVLGALGIIATWTNKTDTNQTLCWLTFAIAMISIWMAGCIRLPHKTSSTLNFLGELSYPLYLFHIPLCLALFYYTEMRSIWGMISATFIGVVILNYALDYWLKAKFWKPLITYIGKNGTRFIKSSSPESQAR